MTKFAVFLDRHSTCTTVGQAMYKDWTNFGLLDQVWIETGQSLDFLSNVCLTTRSQGALFLAGDYKKPGNQQRPQPRPPGEEKRIRLHHEEVSSLVKYLILHFFFAGDYKNGGCYIDTSDRLLKHSKDLGRQNSPNK